MGVLTDIAQRFGVCLLYHATFDAVPSDISARLDNVAPAVLHDQLTTLRRDFTFVSVDELAEAPRRTGLAAVTFDDGYRCVIEQALPVLADLQIPATIYINGKAFNGEAGWRDKVRYLIENDLVEAFEAEMHGIENPRDKTFYRYSKDFCNDSRWVETEIDRFLDRHRIEFDLDHYQFDSADWIVEHPLLNYGNHSHSHYVLASLTPEQQYDEIDRPRRWLTEHDVGSVSEIFSMPFGGVDDFNDATVRILTELGYRGMLLTRARLQPDAVEFMGLPVLERIMPRSGPIAEKLTNAAESSVIEN
ncbi:MAG: polysaccharide deacetylase family protein [Gammaproteobacteria bacterium]|nr:polysaccharide deacetylase family protein [Gammaproteobacteria bacterium]MDH3466447.1 polysaccharide deacetylase family protein [Gammaproteobacteria bacterium]